MVHLVRRGRALLTLGNHDDALLRRLCGEQFDTEKGGLIETLTLIDAQPDKKALKKALVGMLRQAPLYLVLDGGALIVAHAGIEEEMIGRLDAETRRFVLNGDAIDAVPTAEPFGGTGRQRIMARRLLSAATRPSPKRLFGTTQSTLTPALTGAAD